MQKLLTGVRIAAYHVPNKDTGATFLEYDKLTEDRLTFMASTRTEFSHKLYGLVDSVKMPTFEAILQLGFVGNSSLNSIACLTDKEDGSFLAKNINQVVTVDKTTRKPTPIPDWWKNKYMPVVEGNERLIVPALEIPPKTYAYDIRVAWSDIDIYWHTNYLTYIRYCLDTAKDGIVKNYYAKFHDDILQYHVKSMDIMYRGESKAGDRLDVKSWENPDDPYLLHFDISVVGKTIFQNSMHFYEPLT